LSILETETADPTQTVKLPEWLVAEKEVTQDQNLASYVIAKVLKTSSSGENNKL
jgi:CYTH domain-containing protein